MTNEEFSNGFDTLVNSYRRIKDFDKQEPSDTIEFDEYEKSLYLTKAQEELVIALYNGKNPYGDSFELTEEMRRYLDSLVWTAEQTPLVTSTIKRIRSDAYFFELPSDCWFVIYEAVELSGDIDGCKAGAVLDVYPVRHDEYHRIKKNPFRGANGRRALRLDSGDDIVEIICNYPVSKYYLRYLKNLTPIVLEDLPNGLTVGGEGIETPCLLHEALHQKILELAVTMGLQSKGYQYKRQKEDK